MVTGKAKTDFEKYLLKEMYYLGNHPLNGKTIELVRKTGVKIEQKAQDIFIEFENIMSVYH